MNQPQFDLTLETSHFSVKKLLETMGIALPVKTSQPEALTDLALSVKIKGNVKEIALSDGLFQLDQSKLRFKAGLSEFEKPRIDFDGKLDQFNADHYLPPAESKPAGPAPEPAGNKEKIEKVNYAPLRKMILNAKLQIDSLTIHKVNLTDMLMKVTGKNGVFNIDPFNLKLYQGAIQSRTTLDVTREKPQTQAVMQVQGVEAGPLIRDLLQKDILEGKLDADLNLKADGDDLAAIRQSLNGNGNMVFKDGAIVGVDLSAMVQNIQAAFSGQAAAETKPRTDFTEFKLPFTITNGLFETKGTSLASPFLRVQALGKANLVNEGLDFRVEPKIVTAIEGQGDQAKRKGITVPINVTGTFSNPKFTPDLSGMLKKGVEKIITDQLQGGDKKKKISVEDLLKGLFDE
jgi:AsmA protein